MSKAVSKNAAGKSGAMQGQASAGSHIIDGADQSAPMDQLLRLQSKSGNQAIQAWLGSGKPLPESVRGEMETRFGTSFDSVRIHDNEKAHQSAKLLQAKAFTYGPDIVFGAGHFAPGRQAGRYLLAHELAHVIQQRGREPGPLNKARISQPDDAPERAADHAAQAIDTQSAIVVQPVTSLPTLARAKESPLQWETAVETADEWWGKRKTSAYDFLIESIRNIKRERISELHALVRTLPESAQKIANPVIDAYEVVLDITYSLVLGLVGLGVGLVSGIVHAVWGIATGLLNLAYMIGAFIAGFVDERARAEFNDRAGALLEGLKQLGPNLVRLWNAWKEEFNKASPEKQSLMIGELTGQIEALLLQAAAGGAIAGKIPPLRVPALAWAFEGGVGGGGTAVTINAAGPGMATALTLNMANQVEQKVKADEKQKRAETARTTKAAPKTKSGSLGSGEPTRKLPTQPKTSAPKAKRVGPSGVEIPVTAKAWKRLERLQEAIEKSGKWTSLSPNDRFRLGRTLDKIVGGLVERLASGRGTVIRYVEVTPKLLKALRMKGGRVIIIEGRLPGVGRFDFAELNFTTGKGELLDLTSLGYKPHIEKTLGYKKILEKIAGMPFDTAELRYVGANGELLDDLARVPVQ